METIKPTFFWNETDSDIELLMDGKLFFQDTKDHWTNGFCRLVGLAPNQAMKWVESVATEAINQYNYPIFSLGSTQKISLLKSVTNRFFQSTSIRPSKVSTEDREIGPCGHKPDIVWEEKVGNSDFLSVIGCSDCQHGWLVKTGYSNTLYKATNYDEKYFEGSKVGVGYGNYYAQSSWRMEKSHRLLRQIEGIRTYLGIDSNKSTNLLDIGSGYGFFRKAADIAGWEHEGVELSEYAVNMCKTEFNFDTFCGTIEQYSRIANKKFDIITMWDVLEHVENPQKMLEIIKNLLNQDGLCVIRTPNLMALEREILSNYYYSLKEEHVQYFSPKSISLFLIRAGMLPLFLTTDSHFFKGFLFLDQLIYERMLKGSDIFAVAIKGNNEKTV